MKKLILIGCLFAGCLIAVPAGAEDLREWPLEKQCRMAKHVVVGRLELESRAKPIQLDDFGRPEPMSQDWYGGILQVRRSLTGPTESTLSVWFYPCCSDELEAIEAVSVRHAWLDGIWIVFAAPKSLDAYTSVNAVWHPMSRLEEFREVLRSLGMYHEP